MADSNLFDIEENDVVKSINTALTFIIKNKPEGSKLSSVGEHGFTFLRKGTAADASLVALYPAAYVTPSPEAKADQPSAAALFEEKINKVRTVDELFGNLNSYAVLDISSFGKSLAKPACEPGLLDLDSIKAISSALRTLQQEIMQDTSNEAVTAFLLAFLQNLVTYYTSVDLDPKEDYGVYIGYSNNPFLGYGIMRNVVNNAVSNKNIENPLRKYGRLFTATAINLINNGKLQTNTKVLAQHGVVKRFQSYCLDFLRPNYALYNNDQIRAWQLAQRSAFDRKTGATSSTIHNTSELAVK